ncbi:hypothetical protein ACFOYU_12840 [Microvirga sp. GCM10011540]|uniref:hypothetical protein n=1 Tax=Microvirga sp. GCM10011540 TaxID=3317338 RepID=UPI003607960B
MSSQSKVPTPSLSGQDAVLTAPEFHVLPRDLGSFFAQRPLIQGERQEEYDALLAKVTAAVAPTDIVEAVWVKDVVDLIWEAQRLRRLRASLLMLARKEAVLWLLGPQHLRTRNEAHVSLVEGWLAGDRAASQRLESLLAEHGLDLESIMAQALASRLRQVERIDQMIASADARRARVLVELERRREALARRLRMASAGITEIA